MTRRKVPLKFLVDQGGDYLPFIYCLISLRLLEKHPEYKERYPMIASLQTEEEMRESLEFETYAMQIFGLFDEVIQNLENVDAALDEIEHTGKQLTLQLITVSVLFLSTNISFLFFTITPKNKNEKSHDFFNSSQTFHAVVLCMCGLS